MVQEKDKGEIDLIFYGAGTVGRFLARLQRENGLEPPEAFADNDPSKHEIDGVRVYAPERCRELYPDAVWVASVHRTPYRGEILKDIERLGVKSVSLYEMLPMRLDHPPESARCTISGLISHDVASTMYWVDQLRFRHKPDLNEQILPRDVQNVYFEDFYSHLNDEHYVDCGAFDGDTVMEFAHRWPEYRMITAIEPDEKNARQLYFRTNRMEKISRRTCAVGDHLYKASFADAHDQTSHLGGEGTEVNVVSLDGLELDRPTLIKMDIEGYEKEGLWGARNLIKEHSPVLAICAYHKGTDLWEIPLLIHALNPSYRLYFRRYLEATLELIWYAVPPERVLKS